MDVETLKAFFEVNALPTALRVVGALALWVGGRFVIGLLRRGLRAAGKVRRFDATLIRYLDSATHIGSTIVLVLAVLGVFGIGTTSLAGLLAAGGVAIGIAWSGLLANFAAGVFILALSPFRVGDLVGVVGITGVVQEIGMFNTAIDTHDNVRTWVGNARIFADNIQNFTSNGWRRVEVKVPLPAGADLLAAMGALSELAKQVPDAMAQPPPLIEVVAVDGAGTVTVKVAAPAPRYHEVQSELNKAVALWLKGPAASAARSALPAAAR
ncbi:MAG: mechanosensitive ion channel family protein [Archangiaceae bacterium]|nr:mechanosensitive ion channel family protein [Archangiaceae bacterium]